VVHGGGSGSVVPSYVSTPISGIMAAAGTKAIVTGNDGTDIDAAAKAAASADYAIVFAGTLSHEGGDRASLSLDDGCDKDKYNQCDGNAHNQNALIEAVGKANANTIVVLSVPGAILLPWANTVPAILTNFMPGQQAGNAIADVLFGKVNPSAKLPLVFPNVENETQISTAQWPGLPDPKNPTYVYYQEKLLVGHRFYDAHNISFTTGFPFGHGLSYTSFEYSDIDVVQKGKNYQVTFSVKNSGKRAGAEVSQLYLTFPEAAGEPRQLKGFHKTEVLAPGATERVELTLSPRDLSVWDIDSHGWRVVQGQFLVNVGASSRDFRLHASFGVHADQTNLVV